MNRIRLLIALMMIPSLSSAGGVWVHGKVIKSVRAQGAAGQASFITVDASVNPANCGNVDYYGITAQHNPDLVLSALLSAHLAGRTIDFFVLDNECDVFARPSVTDVSVN